MFTPLYLHEDFRQKNVSSDGFLFSILEAQAYWQSLWNECFLGELKLSAFKDGHTRKMCDLWQLLNFSYISEFEDQADRLKPRAKHRPNGWPASLKRILVSQWVPRKHQCALSALSPCSHCTFYCCFSICTRLLFWCLFSAQNCEMLVANNGWTQSSTFRKSSKVCWSQPKYREVKEELLHQN